MIRCLRCLIIALSSWMLIGSVTTADEPARRRVADWGEMVDPLGDCKVVHDPKADLLTISVPGTPHLLSAEVATLPLTAPRVVRPVWGDFQATVRVAGKLEPAAAPSSRYHPYHGAGLLIWKDQRTYLRLERAVATIRGRTLSYLNYELRQDGRLTFSRGIPIEDRPIHLKIERTGSELRAWRSADGSRWTELPDLGSSMSGQVEVGVVAINSSRRLLIAELERFQVELRPALELKTVADQTPLKPVGTTGRLEIK